MAAAHPGLGLLLVFGSRARGDAHPASDWDFGYLGGTDFDLDALLPQLTAILSVDHLDLVDLHRASAQLRYRAAADGRVVYAIDRGIFDRFWMDAVSFWCDAAPVLRAGYAAVLERLDGCPIDPDLLAEKTQAIQRHLQRVSEKLPSAAAELMPSSDAADAVILHLWQATQIVIDLALGACLQLNLGTPSTYADAFRKLEGAGIVESQLAYRLVRAAGFRNIVAHAYQTLDMDRVFRVAHQGPADLIAFLAALRRHVAR
jgi:uncharacterized protein YutE (UPF0331/DUF86 family)/predicted nucleotidyltransferase